MTGFINLTCEQCGGQLISTNDPERYKCKYCGHEYLREGAASSSDSGDISLGLVMCSKCETSHIFDPTFQLTQCPGCGTPLRKDTQKQSSISKAEKIIIPFTMTKKQVDNIILDWLASGNTEFLPSDFFTVSSDHVAFAIYRPFYTFDCTYECSWSGLSGVNSTKTETSYEKTWKVDRNGKLVNTVEPTSRRYTEPDWKPLAGSFKGNYSVIKSGVTPKSREDVYTVPSELFGRVSDEYAQQLLPSHIKNSILEVAAFPEKVYDQQVKQELDNIIHQEVLKLIPGDVKPRDVRKKELINKAIKRLYIPYWIAHFVYKNQRYSIVIDDRTRNLRGNKPTIRLQNAHTNRPKLFFLLAFMIIPILLILALTPLVYLISNLSSIAYQILLGLVTFVLGSGGVLLIGKTCKYALAQKKKEENEQMKLTANFNATRARLEKVTKEQKTSGKTYFNFIASGPK